MLIASLYEKKPVPSGTVKNVDDDDICLCENLIEENVGQTGLLLLLLNSLYYNQLEPIQRLQISLTTTVNRVIIFIKTLIVIPVRRQNYNYVCQLV